MVKSNLCSRREVQKNQDRKGSRPTCLFCHSQIVHAKLSQEQQEKWGDKTIMVPRLQGNQIYVKEKIMQCNQT
jgi:cbb3-type cytochrome oxidase cytochrome c subunit